MAFLTWINSTRSKAENSASRSTPARSHARRIESSDLLFLARRGSRTECMRVNRWRRRSYGTRRWENKENQQERKKWRVQYTSWSDRLRYRAKLCEPSDVCYLSPNIDDDDDDDDRRSTRGNRMIFFWVCLRDVAASSCLISNECSSTIYSDLTWIERHREENVLIM